ncbi:hypothetical protein [Sandarakinorhabdus sp. DWP1-3-1]|uniref:hypothetical protein n=1 Tax=Sandarakinorhabdus sp. DWP1-3-1 TaxID=2804627 RepID=UPI003CF37146
MNNLPANVTPMPNLPQSSESARFDLLQRKAKVFASSPLIPDHLRKGRPEEALANCYIALTMAEAMGENPLIVMQNIHVVSGKAGFAAQYMIARANASGIFAGRIDWRIAGTGKDLAITAFATLRDTGQEISVTVTMAMAEAEGWTKNPKYRSMPEVMLRYRSATFLVRFYCPEVMLGYQSAEEVEDMTIAAGPSLSATPLSGAMLIEQSADTDRVADPAPAALSGDILHSVTDTEAGSDETDEALRFRRPDGQPGYDLAGPGAKAEPPLVERISNAATISELEALTASIPLAPDDDHDAMSILDMRAAADSARARLTKGKR